ncbi:MAG TPA: hypothetical protein VFH59_17975 [Frateuria sp.]|uniref:hypothetical protein n=1 Tax=Frateuria sp. TaxID=2211372 RepID=UPI002D7E3CF5|nr:hypothetical protein [Frateuria sp.]HET6807327.1 hypothetical protein [Frateuria sp.]
MSRQRSRDESGRDDLPTRRAGADHPADDPARPGEHGGDVRRERLDTIEWADDRTRSLDPQRGGLDEDPIDDLLEGGETDAAYRAEARRATPTPGPGSSDDDDGGGS